MIGLHRRKRKVHLPNPDDEVPYFPAIPDPDLDSPVTDEAWHAMLRRWQLADEQDAKLD